MELVLFRHGIAEKYNSRGDAERELTETGIKRVKKAAKGLKYLLKNKKRVMIYSSVLRRARQTADLLAMMLKAEDLFLRDEIVEGRFEELYYDWDYLRADTTILVVGHEPQLSEWLFRLAGQRLELAKGAACAVEIDDIVEYPRARLKWYMTAEALEQIDKKNN